MKQRLIINMLSAPSALKMKQFFSAFILFFIGFFVFAVSSFADGDCTTIYGGSQYGISCPPSRGILVNKKVRNPITGEFVDNLGANDPKYSQDQGITFQVTVTNTSNTKVEHVIVKDLFPQYILFTQGIGTFDNNTKTLTFEIATLDPNESKTVTLLGKVVSAKDLPSNISTICGLANQVNATDPSINDSSQDTAQFCIQKGQGLETTKGGLKVFPTQAVKSTPPTGPEALPLLALIPTGIVGFFTRKKSFIK